MAEYLGHDLMHAIDASICGHPGHHFNAYNPDLKIPGIVSFQNVMCQSEDRQDC